VNLYIAHKVRYLCAVCTSTLKTTEF